MISRKYLYLIALAREQHFGRAAAVCHISPSTLSAAIRDIEVELGTTVVKRGRTFSGLTLEGQRVVDYALRMRSSADNLKQELDSLHHELTGHLTLGVIPTALTVVANLSAAFTQAYPFIKLQILSLCSDEIFQRLQRFEVDAGIVYVESGNEQACYTVPLWTERYVLVSATQANLFAEQNSITWQQASQAPLCLLTPNMHNRRILNSIFQQLGMVLTPTLETDSILSMLAHVATGHWATILPETILNTLDTVRGLTIKQLTQPTFVWQTGLVVHGREPWPPLLNALINTAQKLSTSCIKSE
jgi:DNA-binding transcriptional LysR family regulator